jgi:hypothetical protein
VARPDVTRRPERARGADAKLMEVLRNLPGCVVVTSTPLALTIKLEAPWPD